MASGSAWVSPGMFETNVIVAANSPRARANASTAPVMIENTMPSRAATTPAPRSAEPRVARSSPYGPAHVKRLREWIDDAAVRGHATSHGERVDGLSAVGAPILGRAGTVVAAIGLSGPTVRFTEERVAEFAADLKRVAGQLSERGFDHLLGA